MSRCWLFEVGKPRPHAEWKQRGKPEWSQHVTLDVSSDRALEMIAGLARMLQRAALEGEDRISYTLSGALTQEEDE